MNLVIYNSTATCIQKLKLKGLQKQFLFENDSWSYYSTDSEVLTSIAQLSAKEDFVNYRLIYGQKRMY